MVSFLGLIGLQLPHGPIFSCLYFIFQVLGTDAQKSALQPPFDLQTNDFLPDNTLLSCFSFQADRYTNINMPGKITIFSPGNVLLMQTKEFLLAS